MADAIRIASFAVSKRSPSNASPAMNKDIVNPMPARKPPAISIGHDTPAGKTATPRRTDSQLHRSSPLAIQRAARWLRGFFDMMISLDSSGGI